ncbi:MAG: hypothetical protein NVS3B28_17490 [Candidatus Velthaea sp.]
MYAAIGFILAIGGAAFAAQRARGVSFYAAQVYHMTDRSHRTFTGVSVAFAGGFVIASRLPVLAVPLLAVYVLLLILYASSFARGYSGEDE